MTLLRRRVKPPMRIVSPLAGVPVVPWGLGKSPAQLTKESGYCHFSNSMQIARTRGAFRGKGQICWTWWTCGLLVLMLGLICCRQIWPVFYRNAACQEALGRLRSFVCCGGQHFARKNYSDFGPDHLEKRGTCSGMLLMVFDVFGCLVTSLVVFKTK